MTVYSDWYGRLSLMDNAKRQRERYAQRSPEKVAADKKRRRLAYLARSPEQVEKERARLKRDYQRNRASRLAYAKSYRDSPEQRQRLPLRNARQRERYANDPQFRLGLTLRNRLNNALRRVLGDKGGSAIRDLGCSVEELIKHLEYLMEEGMTWDNHGPWHETEMRWHIDHIKPLASFDLTDREQFLKACHYTNLQPMWARKNLSKGASFDL